MGWHWGILASSGGAAGAYQLLETQVLSSSPTSVTFSGLGSYSDYKHLQFRVANANANGVDTALQIRFNSDTGTNYNYHTLRGRAGTVTSGAQTTTDHIGINNGFSSSSGCLIDILDFSNNSKNTTIRGYSSLTYGTFQIWMTSGLWRNTNSVTSITLIPAFGTIYSGTRISLYGSK